MVDRAGAVEVLDGRLTGAAVVETDTQHILDACRDELAALAGSRVVITGGAGFLGYYLCHTFLRSNRTVRQPVRVFVVDRFIRGAPRWVEGVRLAAEGAITFIQADITRGMPAEIEDAEYVVHAASVASPTYYRQYPIETIDANVWGLRQVLDWSRSASVATRGKLLFFSSSEIYGDPDEIPTPETCRGSVSCTGPRACYDESKRFGETLAVNYARQHGAPVTIARPFNNYGPGLPLDDRRVVPDFARDILEGRVIEMLSDGSPTRTFCYVADAVAGYLKVLVRGRAGEPYNIGVEAPEIAIGELARLMVEVGRDVLRYSGEVVFRRSDATDYLTDNPRRRCPSIAKARQELDYRPSMSLEEGLRRTLVWYRDLHDRART